MLSGKKFLLKTPTIAVDETEKQKVAALLPAKSIVSVISGPAPEDPMVHVTWDDKRLLMFAQDLHQRAEEIH